MIALQIEVSAEWICRKLTLNEMTYEEVERHGECKNPIIKQLKKEYPDMSEGVLELIEQVLYSDIEYSQAAMTELEEFFDEF